MIDLATILHLKPVAEGIERADQLDRLLDLHCALGQGYYFARPLPGPELEVLLAERLAMRAEADALADPSNPRIGSRRPRPWTTHGQPAPHIR